MFEILSKIVFCIDRENASPRRVQLLNVLSTDSLLGYLSFDPCFVLMASSGNSCHNVGGHSAYAHQI